MAQLRDFRDSVAVLVSSCDAFFDCWRPFAFFFRKYWPDCPFQVFLLVNELKVQSQILRSLPVGTDRGWASNLIVALRQIQTPRLLYFQDDYFLDGPVQHDQLAADFAYAFEHDADSLCFRARSDLEPAFQPINDRFGIVPPGSDGRTRCQLTLWKREALLAALRDGETAWEMEAGGSARTRDMRVFSYSKRDDAPVPYLMSAVVRGLWTREAIAMCARENFEIAPRFREIYSPNPLVQRWRRARTRSRLSRELAKRRTQAIDLP